MGLAGSIVVTKIYVVPQITAASAADNLGFIKHLPNGFASSDAQPMLLIEIATE
jgi:hypothetical protein